MFTVRNLVFLGALAFSIISVGTTSLFAAETKKATVIKFDTKEVDGKKLWLPAQSIAKVGEPLTVEVHNSLSAPHGFKIDGYVAEQTIGVGETKAFTFTQKEKGKLKVTCQLHPAHGTAEISVQ